MKINEQEVTVHIHHERRRNSRVSIGKTGIHIRLPKNLPKRTQQQHVEQFLKWAGETIRKKPHLVLKKTKYAWQSGDQITILDKSYTLHISETTNKRASAKVVDTTLYLKLPGGITEAERSDTLTRLISRSMAKHCYPLLWERLNAINARYFQKPLNCLKLKYTTSRWGSCSTKGNINLSTRLLLAPQSVRDYIMVHELAHLVHANHSSAFWNEVARVMPDYKVQEKWLKQYGADCDF